MHACVLLSMCVSEYLCESKCKDNLSVHMGFRNWGTLEPGEIHLVTSLMPSCIQEGRRGFKVHLLVLRLNSMVSSSSHCCGKGTGAVQAHLRVQLYPFLRLRLGGGGIWAVFLDVSTEAGAGEQRAVSGPERGCGQVGQRLSGGLPGIQACVLRHWVCGS